MVNVELGHSNESVLGVANVLAGRLGAEVTGVAACQPLRMIYGDGFLSGAQFEQDREKLAKQMKDAEAEFRRALERSSAKLRWRSTMAFDSPTQWVAGQTRSADLLITSASTASYFDAARRVDAGDLIMRTGRPVLLVPETKEPPALERIVVCWSDSRESMRAATGALPLLKLATQVAVVEVATTQDLSAARDHLEDVALWLRGHGVAVETFALPPTHIDAIELNAFALDRRADLIVGGAFGHSRFREWAFGGVTRDLLLPATRCTLIAS
jgi:nucleotide-binding universal stress UspA family protein